LNWDENNKIIENIFDKLLNNKEVIFLLFGKNKELNNENDLVNEDKYILNLIRNKFGEKSEIIYYENIAKIKSILSFNNIIRDEIIFPNETCK
jgi:hypothetical protein